jgi:hypothetical protein
MNTATFVISLCFFGKRSRGRGENFSISFFVPLFYSMEKERGENEYKRGIRFSLTYPKSYEAGICFSFIRFRLSAF